MSDMLTYQDLDTIIDGARSPCISIYMPTNPDHVERRQEEIIRLRNLLDQVEATVRTVAPELRTPDVEQLLAPARRLLGEERAFWNQEGAGVVIFLAPHFARLLRMPIMFEELVVVGRQFQVKPLLPLLTDNSQFYLLAVSQKAVRLLQGDRYQIDERELHDVPTSLAETLQWDEFERTLQWHGGDSPASTGGRVAMFHGQDIGTAELHKEQLQRFLHQLSAGLQKVLNGEKAPLILAGVGYVVAIYRQLNLYPHLIDQALLGNPDELTNQQLHEAAWALIEPLLESKRQQAIERYRALEPTKRACGNLRTILTAAHHGRVDTLFTAVGQQQWGYYDAESGYIHTYEQREPGSDDLFNLAAIYTLKNGGTLFPVAPADVPGQSGIAAIYRY